MNNYIGIDLGGTNVRVAKIDDKGTIIQQLKSVSYAKQGREAVLSNVLRMVKAIDDYKECEGIGFAVPGPVVDDVIKMSTNLPGFTDYPLGKEFSKLTGIPVFVENDANAAGLAEALVGAGKGRRFVYYITHSTGIGGAMVIDGKVISGAHGFAGEIGNIIVDPNGSSPNHLNKGAVENLASGLVLSVKAKELYGVEDASVIFEKYRLKDENAITIVDSMCKDLAIAMSAIGHVLDPDCFIIGGGVSNASDDYFPLLEKYYKARVHQGLMQECEILKASLKEPGIVGAAMLVKSRLGHEKNDDH